MARGISCRDSSTEIAEHRMLKRTVACGLISYMYDRIHVAVDIFGSTCVRVAGNGSGRGKEANNQGTKLVVGEADDVPSGGC